MQIRDLTMTIQNLNRSFAIGIFSAIITLALYFLSPEDLSLRMVSPFASRFVWTPLIPLSVGTSSFFLLYGSLSGQFTHKQTYAASLAVSVLVVMSFQLAIASPMGPDGWFFVEASIRFRDYGALTREFYSYFDHPLIMMLIQPLITVWPSQAAFFCSALGFALGVLYFAVILYALSEHQDFERWGVMGSLVISAIIALYWNPIQFSAQLLSLVMIYSIFHLFLVKGHTRLAPAIVIAALLPVSHLFAPLFLIAALLMEAYLRTEISRESLVVSLVCSLSFILWNLTQAKSYYERQISSLPELAIDLATSPVLMMTACIVVHWILLDRYSTLGNRKNVVWGEGKGVRNLSILAGALALLPVLYIQDSATLAARFTPRLILFSVVPLIAWSRYPLQWTLDYIDREQPEKMPSKAIVLMVASVVLSGVTVFGHINLSERTWILPEDTLDCWEDAEELGIPVLMTRTRMSMDDTYYEGSTILISPMVISPALPHYYYKLVDNGDGSRFDSTETASDIVAIIMTSDMPNRIERNGPNINFEEFTKIGATNNACEYWVKNNSLNNLDPEIPWNTEFIAEHPDKY